jgi:DNA-directed RNA polymerase specialized sigma24 family protein
MQPRAGVGRLSTMSRIVTREDIHVTEAGGGRLAELYGRHAAEAIRLAYMLTGDRTLAEDLVQDAFVKLAGRPAEPTPHADAPDLDRRDDLWEHLQRLPLRQRTAVVLRIYEDLPEQRVAEILGCRPGTVRSLLSRGLAELRINVRSDDDG